MRSKLKSITDPYSVAAVTLYVILGAMVVAALAVAFTHAHDLSQAVLPQQHGWKNWVNAVLSELLPTAAGLACYMQWRTKRKVYFSLAIIAFSLFVSGVSQLYAAGHLLPGTREFLAVWPVIAALLVGKLGWSEIVYSVERRAALLAAAERVELAAQQAEREREKEAREEVRRAERAAELRRRTEEDRAARAAEKQAQREAVQLAAQREHELKLAAQAASAEAVRAAAVAAQQAEAARLRMAEQSALLAAQRHEAEERRRDGEAQARHAVLAAQAAAETRVGVPANGMQVRHGAPVTRPRPAARDRAQVVQKVLDALGDVPRDEAVRTVAAQLDIAARTARNFVPDRWPAVRTAVVPDRSGRLTSVPAGGAADHG